MTTRDKNIVGEVLAKTYRIERFLGVGTIGTVYVARHVRSGGLYAVKVLHRKLAASPELYQRFQDEARLIATLRHPHIVPITDFDRDDNAIPFFVMDLLEGENLQQRLKHKEMLPLSQSLEILQQVGSALSAAHRSGIVHRNVKLENIYLVRHDLGDRVTESAKVTDFGLSRFRRVAPAGTLDAAHGVSAYMAPEMLQESTSPIDGRADQWALAVIGYRMLSGKLPFEDSSPEELQRHILNDPPRPLNRLMPELPSHVVTALNRGMAKRREDRYESMLDFVRAVTSKATGTVAVAPGPAADADPAAPQSRAASPSGRVAAVAPPIPSARIAVVPPPPAVATNRPPAPPAGSAAAPAATPPSPATAAAAPAPPIAPPVPGVPVPPAASAPSASPAAAAPPAVPVTAASPSAAAPPIPAAAPAPAPAASPPSPSAATPAPLLAAPPLLLPESNAAPVVEEEKRPSWGFLLGGAALAILAGLGLTLLLESRQQRPQLPIGTSDDRGSVTASPAPTAPVVEALDLLSPPPPPPPAVDAAAQLPTPIAPHVPLPPLRGPDSPVPTPATTPGAVDPTKAAGTPTGTDPSAPSAVPGKTPGTPAPPSAPGLPPGAPGSAAVPGSPTAPRPQKPPAATGVGSGDPGAGPAAGTPAGDPSSGAAGKTPTAPAGSSTAPAGSSSGTAPAADSKDKSTDELMKEAQAAYVRGERGRATELALQVAEGGGPDAERAWRFIGSAACSVRNALMANKAYTKLESSEHKQMILELCQRNGLSFQNGTFGPSSSAPGGSGSSGSPSSSGSSGSAPPDPQ